MVDLADTTAAAHPPRPGWTSEYDAEVDILTLRFVPADRYSDVYAESRDDIDGLIVDLDENGSIIGLELLNASDRTADPTTAEHTVVGDPNSDVAQGLRRAKASGGGADESGRIAA